MPLNDVYQPYTGFHTWIINYTRVFQSNSIHMIEHGTLQNYSILYHTWVWNREICRCVIVRPWSHMLNVRRTRQIWGIWKLRPAYSPETPNLGQNRWCFVPCDLEIWWMTLENNRASLLCCFKLCATFHSHWWIQTGVTVRKRPIWVKFDGF